MKKILLILTILFIISGCNLNNNPNSKVEELLGKYQMLDNDIVISYNDITENDNISNDLKERYNKIIKKTYRNLSYDIKDTKINGNNCIVTTEIEVNNNKKIIDNYKDNYSKMIDELEHNKDKITYTIDFPLIKINDTWILEAIDTDTTKKLLGIY